MHPKMDPCEKSLENAKKKVETLPVSSGNRKAILDFSDSCFSEGLSTRRVLKYLYTLAQIATWVPKEFPETTR